MTIVEELVSGASGSGDVAGLLRRLKVVASRTKTPRLATWANREVEGYAEVPKDEVPAYRGPFDNLQTLGQFVGPLNHSVQGVLKRPGSSGG